MTDFVKILVAAERCVEPDGYDAVNVRVLKFCIDEYVNEAGEFNEREQKFLLAARVFLKKHNLGSLYNLDEAKSTFQQSIREYEADPSKLLFDPLAKLTYVWPQYKEPLNEAEPEVEYYWARKFIFGRPIDNKFTVSITKIEDFPEEYKYGILIPQQSPVPYLYILMRTDIGSMNPGKAVAQGTHAANQMVHEALRPMNKHPWASAMLTEWSQEANGFGTCIVLGASEKQMRSSIASAKNAGLHCGITHDPSYPVKDGGAFYTIPMDTCAYIFDYPSLIRPHVSELELMP